MKHSTFALRSGPAPGRLAVAARRRAGTSARTGLVAVVAGLALSTAMGASGAMEQAAFVSAAPASQIAAQTAPAPPAGLVATAGAGQVTLSWDAPASDDGSAATSYNVYAGTTEDFTASTRRASVRGLDATVTGLTNGTTYYFWVTAENDAGQSDPSAVASATPAAAATTPGSPAGLTAIGGMGRIALSWTAPASDGGSPVTGYDIYLSATQAFRGGVRSFTSTGTSVVITNLADGTTYYVKVAAVNARGTGPASAAASATTLAPVKPTAPGPPTGLSAEPGRAQVTLSWAAPAGHAKISGYLIYEGTRPGGESSTPITSSATRTSYTVAGLASGTRYYFKVAAVDTAGRRSVLSAEASAVPLPVQVAPPGGGQPGGGQPGGGQPGGGLQSPASAGVTNLTSRQSPHRVPAGLIILLAAVAVASSAGAVAAAVHLRRMRLRRGSPWSAGPDESAGLDRRPPDLVSGRRYR